MSRPGDLPEPRHPGPVTHTVIEPRGRATLQLGEVWRYRELLYFLIWRDVKVRYKQTLLGASWAVLQPLAAMVVFTIVFGNLVAVPSDGLPYPVFAFAALVPWTYFSVGLAQASNSLVNSQNLLKKVYFPRLVIPLAAVLAGLVDFAVAMAVLLGLMLLFGVVPQLTALAVIPLLALACVTAFGVGLWLSALNVRYRDIRHILPFLIQVWLFATPIAYPSSLIDEPWRTVFALNPMVGVVEGFRWALLGADTAPGAMVLVSTTVAIAILVSGLYFFRHHEGTFADAV